MTGQIRECNGAILIDKPAGITSAAVVAQLKRRFGFSRVGHAGTLDPAATGLLIVLFGKATRLQPLFLESAKEYSGVMRLGLGTDSDDLTGNICEEDAALEFARRMQPEEILALIRHRFSGRTMQTPPQYSAVHVSGKRSYALARKCVPCELEARAVEIEFLRLGLREKTELEYEIRCSKGTYVRALARDIGRALGSCGCVASIRRTAAGPFRIECAQSLSCVLAGELETVGIGLAKLVAHLPRFELSREDCLALKRGNQQALALLSPRKAADGFGAVFDPDQSFVGLICREQAGDTAQWRLRFVA
ncbi:MAG TPA: tRNA pseudouridine(55) synthase TruB [Oligoflexia bacterium]|nr:tRNA pseudouridine(55) synthase TruB [Oligoflexia bacterium]